MTDTFSRLLDDISERVSRDRKRKQSLTLLYHTIDKADVEEFHSKCDNKGRTATILHGRYNAFFGGYTSKSWTSPDSYQIVNDESAFLFVKNDIPNAECIFFPIKENETHKAIVCKKAFGPTFGGRQNGKHDLQAFKKDRKCESTKEDGYLKLNGTLNWNQKYSNETTAKENEVKGNRDAANYVDQKKFTITDINSGHLIVSKIEVYLLTDDEMEENWRTRLEGDDFKKKKQELIKKAILQGCEIDHYNILLLGAVGVGKSSFINTLLTVFTGKCVQTAQSRQAISSVTNKVNSYVLQTENEKKTIFRIFDIRGFETGRDSKVELTLLINGQLPENYEFRDNPEVGNIPKKENPLLNDKIHMVCFVEGNQDFDKYGDQQKQQRDNIRCIIDKEGLPTVVIATKFDKHCSYIRKEIDHIYKCRKAETAVADIAEFYGFSTSQVLPVVNYIDEETPVEAKDQLALTALDKISVLTEDYLQYHPEKKPNIDNWTARKDLLITWENNVDKRTKVHTKMLDFDDSHLRILVVGPVDSGKSSYIHSVKSALLGKIIYHTRERAAYSRTEILSSTTGKFQLYPLEYAYDNTATRWSGIYLGDTPGFQEKDGIKPDTVKSIISGHVPDGQQIIHGVQETQEDLQEHSIRHGSIHGVCLVFDCEKVQKGLSDTMKRSMTEIRQMIDCPFVVLLTKCDQVSNSWNNRRQSIFEDNNVKDCMQRLVEEFGFKQYQVYPIVNYNDNNIVDKETDRLILGAFFGILDLGKTYLENNSSASGN